MTTPKIFKVSAQHISNQKRKILLRWLVTLGVCSVILWLQGSDDIGSIKTYVGIWIFVCIFLGYNARRDIRFTAEAMQFGGIALGETHVSFYERGRETRIAYKEFTKTVFRGSPPNVRSIRLIANEWMNEKLPEYEDFQLVATKLLEKLPSSIIKHKGR